MDFLTIDMVKAHCRIESYDRNPDRQAEIDNNIKAQANKAEQEVYAHIGRDYFDIIREWGYVPACIKSAALTLTAKGLGECQYDDGNVVSELLRPFKKIKARTE